MVKFYAAEPLYITLSMGFLGGMMMGEMMADAGHHGGGYGGDYGGGGACSARLWRRWLLLSVLSTSHDRV